MITKPAMTMDGIPNNASIEKIYVPVNICKISHVMFAAVAIGSAIVWVLFMFTTEDVDRKSTRLDSSHRT